MSGSQRTITSRRPGDPRCASGPLRQRPARTPAAPLACAAVVLGALAGCPPSGRDAAPAPDGGGAKGRQSAALRRARQQPQPPALPERGPLAQRVLYEQAKGLLRAGQAARALEIFRRAIAAHGEGDLLPSVYLGVGSALGELGRHAEAVEAYRRVVALRPEDADAHRALAIGQEDAGSVDDARRSLEQALALQPELLSVYQDLAALHLRGKDMDGARKVYLSYELQRTRLIKRLGLSRDPAERTAAAVALGDARDEATVKALGLALSDADRGVRLAVIDALGQQALRAGAGPLREALGRTTDAEERRHLEASIEAIRRAPQPEAAPPPSPPSSSGAVPGPPEK